MENPATKFKGKKFIEFLKIIENLQSVKLISIPGEANAK